jgi:hypothetical protein
VKTADVKKLSPPARFLYWCRERWDIYLRRRSGAPKPWTDDEVLRDYFFTMPYREKDKTTVWFRDKFRGPMRDSPSVLMGTVIFRWFNHIPTGVVLLSSRLLEDWNSMRALMILGPLRNKGTQIFTGAYMINSPGGVPKLEAICGRVSGVWRDREDLVNRFVVPLCFGPTRGLTMEEAHGLLTRYDGMGGFMAYEVVCDLRHTFLLENARDVMTWCNPGPGCLRGLYRLAGEEWASKGNNATSPPRPKDWADRMARLLAACRRRLVGMPPFEMREVEHSLCEWDKYERALCGDGRLKRVFKGAS